MLERLTRLPSFRKWSRRTEAPFGGLATTERTFGKHQIIQITPRILTEEGTNLIKDNWVVQNPADPDHFNHFLVHIAHLQEPEPKLPALILIPGIFCNGNLFRIVRAGGNFRDLDTTDSFANYLAHQGYPVVVVHPRYAQWIYRRYVEAKLGIKNYFSDAVTFERLKNDIPFFLDVTLGLTGRERAVIIGFSLGGMETLDYLSRNEIDPRLAGAIFMGTPGYFSTEQLLVHLLKIYNYLAGISISERHQILKVISRNINPLKYLLQAIPPSLLRRSPLVTEIFNPAATDLETMVPFINYVLEPITSAMVEYFQLLARRGDFVAEDGKTKILEGLSRPLPPLLFLCGSEDRLAPEIIARKPYEAVTRSQKKFEVVPGAGHVDLITGKNSALTLKKILGFLSEISGKS